MNAKVFLVNKRFSGLPKISDFTLTEETLPPIKNGEFLVEAVYLSVDPYQRSFAAQSGVGNSLYGEQVARILDSKNDKYPVGKYVVGDIGWRTYSVVNEGTKRFFPLGPRLLTEEEYQPLSLALGMLGMTGNTAYFGFENLCKPKKGDVVVVNAAAGAVGSHVGQIAKIHECHVVGITGSNEKCHWVKKGLNFDEAINYKDGNFEQKLAKALPKGIDCYFDNVGGELSNIILTKMNNQGRVAICGSISTYNDNHESELEFPKDRHLKVQHVDVFKHKNEWLDGINQNRKWLLEGKLKYKETVTKGFENMPNAFISMLQGGNIGKAIVEV